jgi:hypothetical protein
MTFTSKDFEHAARAAGLDIWTGGGQHDDGGYPVGMDSDGGCEAFWNPPDDDGDALRLAVMLRFTVAVRTHEVEVFSDESGECLASIHTEGCDPMEATRTAIFRASIAIGKAMADGHHQALPGS